MKKYIMSLDCGTTSNRCILFDHEGNICAMAQKELTQYFPHPGWVEQDAQEIFATIIGVAREAMARIGIKSEDIEAIGITNQRETTIVWDKTTGAPVSRAIVWQCRRTSDICNAIRNTSMAESIMGKTGLVIDPYFSATKLKWILDNVPGCKEKAEKGELLFGTVDTWVIWNFTRGKTFATDYSNAARTMLYNIHDLKWDEELCDYFEIPMSMLPEVRPTSGSFGETATDLFGGSIPITGVAGDQQAALFGQACYDAGEIKSTYGTGGFLLMNTGEKIVRSRNGLVTTIAWGIDNKVTYALEGSVFVAGAAIQWLRDELGIMLRSEDSERLAQEVKDTNGCYFVPAFTGLGAPYWKQDATGMITGLTRGVNRFHLTRAALESIAYQIHDVLCAMEADSGISLSTLKIDGGASANNFLAQFQADISHILVDRPVCIETTAMGAAYLAGLATGFWKDTKEIRSIRQTDRFFVPEMEEEKREAIIASWHEAVRRCTS